MLRVEVREAGPDELGFVAGVAARGLRDNPMPAAVLGPDAAHRERALERSFAAVIPKFGEPPLAAWRGNYIVGVAGMAPPGRCQLSPRDVLRMLPRIRPTRLADVRRTIEWLGEWEKYDPAGAHWHLGPVAVEGGMQGMGIGSQLMEAFCERMDSRRELSYLETDKPQNVVFYERFGFEVADEAEVLGTPNWFMLREPG